MPASVPIGKEEFTSFLHWQHRQLKKLRVQILLNTNADEELIRLYEPDTLILATGSKHFIPPFKGHDKDIVVNAHDVLSGKVSVGENVVVIGGGLVGAETADLLSQNGSKVTIIEMLPQIMKDGEASPTFYMKERFKEYGVSIYTSTKLTEIG
ncbi:MAG: FAD-dependent oxidoreductase, partial [Turicibacter sp.]|nr:FAD-dependent oxidoreductase [Turicibacter sp.]